MNLRHKKYHWYTEIHGVMLTKITESTEHINAQSGFNGVLTNRGVIIWIPTFQHVSRLLLLKVR